MSWVFFNLNQIEEDLLQHAMTASGPFSNHWNHRTIVFKAVLGP